MTSIGYAAMLEQFAPAEVLAYAARAESLGFTGVLAADHFQPWTAHQGQASFMWNVLSALGGRTAGGLATVTTPTFRMHPAVTAQASATLAALYPGRHWLGIGSGEALNEHITGRYWPEPPERIDRMFDAIELIKKLFSSGLAQRDVRHDGAHFRLESTRLWTMPAQAPAILVATAGPVTAKRAGRTADGLITEAAGLDKAATLLQRFAEGAREAGRPRGRFVLRMHLSWAATQAEAEANAVTEWPNAALRATADIRSPFELEQLARLVRPEDFEGRMLVSADAGAHLEHIRRYLELGFDEVYLHNVGRNQEEWLDVFAAEVLPELQR